MYGQQNPRITRLSAPECSCLTWQFNLDHSLHWPSPSWTPSLYKRGNWGPERESDFFKVTQQIWGRLVLFPPESKGSVLCEQQAQTEPAWNQIHSESLLWRRKNNDTGAVLGWVEGKVGQGMARVTLYGRWEGANGSAKVEMANSDVLKDPVEAVTMWGP